jgi:uncharacterized damage-inducible protein DinB
MWHGPSLVDLVGDVSAEQAAERPVPGAHTIWELVLHLTTWTDIVRDRMHSRDPVEATPEQDWPRVRDTSADAWRDAVEALKESKRLLAEDVRALADAKFDERVPGRDYGLGVMLRGVVEHDRYHGGQIALLKRALIGKPLT